MRLPTFKARKASRIEVNGIDARRIRRHRIAERQRPGVSDRQPFGQRRLTFNSHKRTQQSCRQRHPPDTTTLHHRHHCHSLAELRHVAHNATKQQHISEEWQERWQRTARSLACIFIRFCACCFGRRFCWFYFNCTNVLKNICLNWRKILRNQNHFCNIYCKIES